MRICHSCLRKRNFGYLADLKGKSSSARTRVSHSRYELGKCVCLCRSCRTDGSSVTTIVLLEDLCKVFQAACSPPGEKGCWRQTLHRERDVAT